MSKKTFEDGRVDAAKQTLHEQDTHGAWEEIVEIVGGPHHHNPPQHREDVQDYEDGWTYEHEQQKQYERSRRDS